MWSLRNMHPFFRSPPKAAYRCSPLEQGSHCHPTICRISQAFSATLRLFPKLRSSPPLIPVCVKLTDERYRRCRKSLRQTTAWSRHSRKPIPIGSFGSTPVMAPAICGPIPHSTGKGQEIFIYLNGNLRPPNSFWQGLISSRLPIRMFDPRLNDSDISVLERAGVDVCRKPVPFEEVVARSRLLLSHGGLGFVSSGLIAGLPQIIFPFDTEKLLTAKAVSGKSGCIGASFDGLKADVFSAFLRKAWSDERLHAQAQASAPGFRSRMTRKVEEEAADIVEAMV